MHESKSVTSANKKHISYDLELVLFYNLIYQYLVNINPGHLRYEATPDSTTTLAQRHSANVAPMSENCVANDVGHVAKIRSENTCSLIF